MKVRTFVNGKSDSVNLEQGTRKRTTRHETDWRGKLGRGGFSWFSQLSRTHTDWKSGKLKLAGEKQQRQRDDCDDCDVRVSNNDSKFIAPTIEPLFSSMKGWCSNESHVFTAFTA